MLRLPLKFSNQFPKVLETLFHPRIGVRVSSFFRLDKKDRIAPS